MAPYVFEPLDPSKRTIWVLRLLCSPATTDELHCETIETIPEDLCRHPINTLT